MNAPSPIPAPTALSLEPDAKAASWRQAAHLRAIASMFEYSLSEADKRARIDFMHRQPLLHRRLRNALAEVEAYRRMRDCKLIFVIAPGGAGKTCIQEEVIERVNAPHFFDPQYRRAIRVKAVTYSGSTHWASLYSNIEKALQVPRPGKTNQSRYENIKCWLVSRKTELVLIDEAHDLMPKRSVPNPDRDAGILKSMIGDLPVRFMLLGTYKLAPATVCSDEIIWRSHAVHLRRYHEEKSDDWETFRIMLEYIDSTCGQWLDEPLAPRAAQVYGWCAGLVGRLRTILANALDYGRANGTRTISPMAIQLALQNQAQSESVRRICDAGEVLCESMDAKRQAVLSAARGSGSFPHS